MACILDTHHSQSCHSNNMISPYSGGLVGDPGAAGADVVLPVGEAGAPEQGRVRMATPALGG